MPKTKKMLSDWDAPYIQPLVKLIETQSKETLAEWVIGYSETLYCWCGESSGSRR